MGTALLLFFLHFTDDDVDDGVCVWCEGVFLWKNITVRCRVIMKIFLNLKNQPKINTVTL